MEEAPAENVDGEAGDLRFLQGSGGFKREVSGVMKELRGGGSRAASSIQDSNLMGEWKGPIKKPMQCFDIPRRNWKCSNRLKPEIPQDADENEGLKYMQLYQDYLRYTTCLDVRDRGISRARSSCLHRNLFDQREYQSTLGVAYSTIEVDDETEQFCLYRLFDENPVQTKYPKVKHNHQRLAYEFFFFEN